MTIDDPDIATAMRFIRDHASEPVSVKDLLRAVPISRTTLHRATFRGLMRSRSAKAENHAGADQERAKDLLGDTAMTILAVARASGFRGQEIFSMAFHREVGMSPTLYRRRCRIRGMVMAK